MARQGLIYLLMSIFVIVFARYAHALIVGVDNLYLFLNAKLSPLFNSSGAGLLIRRILVLVAIPVIMAAIPALIYRVIRGGTMPYFFELTWLFWLIVVLSIILVR